MKAMLNPLGRRENILEQELPNELLIYDLLVNKAYCLNKTSALVWRLCDGEKSIAEIRRIISKKLNSPLPEDFVWLALEQLKEQNLLENTESIEEKFNRVSRRAAVKKVGLASMVALPMISSIVAPKSVDAQSVSDCGFCPFNEPTECQLGGFYRLGCFATSTSCFTAGGTSAAQFCCNGQGSLSYSATGCCIVFCNP